MEDRDDRDQQHAVLNKLRIVQAEANAGSVLGEARRKERRVSGSICFSQLKR